MSPLELGGAFGSRPPAIPAAERQWELRRQLWLREAMDYQRARLEGRATKGQAIGVLSGLADLAETMPPVVQTMNRHRIEHLLTVARHLAGEVEAVANGDTSKWRSHVDDRTLPPAPG